VKTDDTPVRSQYAIYDYFSNQLKKIEAKKQ